MIDMIFDIPIQSTYITLQANDVHYLFWAQLSVCDDMVLLKVIRPSFFGGVPSYFEALWYPHLYFYRKSNT